ncbi:universal stress protein [Cytobacillus pseudoceanisediminis]|uniref:universal stress protein n=1 Tax=Cytobacillus pseudoceanisediminis TaxID=3051614 RepID=UPI003CE738A5
MNKILFPTDGSAYSEHAARMTGEFLEAWPNATGVVIYVTVKENYAYDFALKQWIDTKKNLVNILKRKLWKESFNLGRIVLNIIIK